MMLKILGCSFITAGAIGAVNLPTSGLRIIAVAGLLFGVLFVLWPAEEEE